MRTAPAARRRAVVTLLALLAGVTAWVTPAAAQGVTEDGAITIVTGRTVTVAPDEDVDVLVVLDGDAVIDGVVDVVVTVTGDVLINGRVRETAVALSGVVGVSEGGEVGGDVLSADEPEIAPGATVEGDVRRVAFDELGAGVLGIVGFLVWLVATLGLLAIGAAVVALAPRGVEGARRLATTEIGTTVLVALAVGVGLPVAIVLVALTLFGIPVALWLVALGVVLYGVGYVVAGRIVGGLMIARSPIGATLLGIAILQVVAAIPFVTFIGPLAALYGVGAMALATWRARGPAPVPAPTPPPAVPTGVGS